MDTNYKERHPSNNAYNRKPGKLSLARLEHFTWAWFTITMATGGMALLLASQPHSFRGLFTIGTIVYIWDLVLFTLNCTFIAYRFIKYPGTLKASLTHPSESLFFATFWLSITSIIGSMGKYGVPSSGPWLVTTYRILFWTYFCLSFLSAVFHYYQFFTSPSLKIQDATPAWDLPIFPFMLTGTIASIGVPFQPTLSTKMCMLVAGLTAQGLGMLVSIIMYTIYVRRMIQFGLPSPSSRPAMFISVGPPSFTSLAIIGLAKAYPDLPPADYFGDVAITRQVLLILATFTSIFIWGLAFWFFCISLLANLTAWRGRQLGFRLNWWAFVFPNIGFTIATIDIGQVLRSDGVTWVGSAMTCILVVVYVFVFFNHIRAVYRGDILADGKDEDLFVHEKMDKLETGQRKNWEAEKIQAQDRADGIRHRSMSVEMVEHGNAG